jgi:type I restriction enzyme S subunit
MAGERQPIPFEQLLAEPVRNGVYKPKAFHGHGAKIVNMGELFAHPRLRAVPMKRVELSGSESRRFTLSKGDLLFARRSLVADGAGKCSIVLDIDEPTTFESSIIRARPDRGKAEPAFLYYFFNSTAGLHCLDTIRRQVAVAGITGSDLSRLEIPVPPLSEQRAIAHILGTLDNKIELNRRMNETLEAMARAIFKSWFVDFDPVRAKAESRPGGTGLPKEIADLFPDHLVDSELGQIPEGWEVGSLADFASLNPETWSKDTCPEIINYVDLSNTKWGRIEAVATYTWQDAPSRAQRVLRPCDTILGTVRPGNGSYAFVAEDGLTGSTGFAVLRPHRAEYAAFIYLAATAAENIEALSHLADGGAYPAVRPEVVGATQIVKATDELLRAFSRAVGPLLSKMASSERQSRTLASVRDALLPKLISGELRLNDAEKLVEGAV